MLLTYGVLVLFCCAAMLSRASYSWCGCGGGEFGKEYVGQFRNDDVQWRAGGSMLDASPIARRETLRTRARPSPSGTSAFADSSRCRDAA